MKLITEEWLKKANEDLMVVREIIDKEHLTNIIAFHSQQAVEKTLKAVIEESELQFIKTHNLETLFGTIENQFDFDVNLGLLKRLDNIYISARYPSDLGLLPSGKPSIEEVKEMYEFAKDLHDQTRRILENTQSSHSQ